VRQYLSTLVPSGLWRSQRLKDDISNLTKTFKVDKTGCVNDQAKAFTTHIHFAARDKPHVLLAYGWVMYMATFSGGRWIRQQLQDAGPGFWRVSETLRSETRDVTPGVSFLSFAGDKDGEDIKTAFKTQLAKADVLLTPEEKQEVVDEAKTIFENCIAMVEELDRRLDTATRLEDAKDESTLGSVGLLLGMGKKSVHERLKENRESMPNAYPTQDVNPYAAFFCICVGLGLWYFLRSSGWLTSSGPT